MSGTMLVKARSGVAFEVKAGARFRVIDVEGQQVSDLVAFLREDLAERLSQANTRKLNAAVKLNLGQRVRGTRMPATATASPTFSWNCCNAGAAFEAQCAERCTS